MEASKNYTLSRQQTRTLLEAEAAKRQEEEMADKTMVRSESAWDLDSSALGKVTRESLQRRRGERRVRMLNLVQLFLAVSACIIMILIQHFVWDYATHKEISMPFATFLQFVLSAITLVHIVVLFIYYNELIVIGQQRSRWSGFHLRRLVIFQQEGLLVNLLLEVIVVLVHAPPLVGIDNKASMFCFLRIYVALRVLRDWSPAYRMRREIIAAASEDASMGSFGSASWIFGLKWWFNQHTLRLVATGWALTVLMLSFCVYITERGRNSYRVAQNYSYTFNFPTSIYFVIVTSTTLGYGDIVPLSDWGRGVSVVTAVVGIMMSSFLVAAVANKLAFDRREAYGALYLKWKAARMDEQKSAARLIKVFVKNATMLCKRMRKREKAAVIGVEMRQRRAASIAQKPKSMSKTTTATATEKSIEMKEMDASSSSSDIDIDSSASASATPIITGTVTTSNEELQSMIAENVPTTNRNRTPVKGSALSPSAVSIQMQERRGRVRRPSMVGEGGPLNSPLTRVGKTSVVPTRGTLAQSMLRMVHDLRRKRRSRMAVELSMEELKGSSAQIDDILVKVVESTKKFNELTMKVDKLIALQQMKDK